jgi:hypothetical protein
MPNFSLYAVTHFCLALFTFPIFPFIFLFFESLISKGEVILDQFQNDESRAFSY